MARLFPLSVFAILVAAAAPALAETDAEKEARIKAAIEFCDKGACAPLHLEAAAPVPFDELFEPYDQEAFKKLATACHAAMIGAPDENRLTVGGNASLIAMGDE